MGLGIFLVFVSMLVLSVYTYTRAGGQAHVSAAVPATLNFQARLLNSSGSIVTDGNYSVEYRLYTASSGGTSVWNETQVSSVKSGYLSVYLGDVNNTLGSLDWSQQYWLTMNVNGDGEMNPRLRLTSVPYAFRSSQADTLTNGSGTLGANDLAQLAPSSVQAVNSALAALRINQTGSGFLAQLQGNGSDVFTVSKTGATTISGDVLAQTTTNSTNALRVQNAGGNTFFGVDTLGNSISLGNTGLATTLQVGNTTGAVNQTINIGNNTTGGSSTTLTMGSLIGTSTTTIQGGTGGVQITSGTNVNIGTNDTTGTLLVVDTKTTVGDPTGTNGAIYYNSFSNKFRCFEGGAWNDCINGVSSSSSASFVSGLQNVPTNTSGAVVETMVFTSATAVSNVAGITGFTAPASGSFRTCMVKNNAAITAGTLALRWRVNGASVGSAACQMDSTNNRQTSQALNPGVVTFAAGDTIGLAFDTSATFAPAGTNDFTVYWSVEYSGSGGGGGGGSFDLQDAYDNSISANILTANNKDITFNLADTAIDSDFVVNIQSGSTGEFKVQDNGTDVLRINSDGDVIAAGGLTFGNSLSTTAGTIRWTGLDFEGFDGASWLSLTSGGGGSGLSSNYVNVVKQTNEVVNNSIALQDDNELGFSIGANEEWTYRFVVQANANAAADFRFAVTAPSGATCFVSFSDPEGATSDGQYGCGVTSVSVPANTATDLYEITGSVKNGATAGVVRLQWAQFTLNASNATVFAGSYLNAFRTIGAGGAGQPFAQSGNSFGTKAVLGTSDNNDLGIITNNSERLTILANGNVGIGDTTPAALFTVGTGDALQVNAFGNLTTTGTVQIGGLTTLAGNLVGSGSATGTTTTATAVAGTNTTTINLSSGVFANNDVIFIDNAGQDYYTRVVSGGGTATITVSPAVSYDASASITKYNIQNVGATGTDYATQANRFFQGYFLGGVVVGAGSTTISDGNIISTGDLVLQRNGGAVTIGGDITVAGTLTGNGSGLTNIDGSAISAASIADSSLSSNVALLSGSQTFTGLKTFNAGLSVSSGASIAGGIDNNNGGLTNVGAISGTTSLSLSGAISGGTTITGSGNINTTGGAILTNSTIRIDNTGNLQNIGSLALSGAISGGTTITGSGDINTTGGGVQTNSIMRINNTGDLVNIGSLTLSGAISGGTTVTGTTLNATTGINTGAGAGTLRIDSSGNLVNITALTLSGAISGGTTITGSGDINTTGGTIQTNSTTRIDNSGNLTNIGNLTASAGITIASGGAGNINLNSASGTLVIDGTDTTLLRTGTGSYTVNLNDSAATSLQLTNSGTGVADLNIVEGSLQVAGLTVLTNGGALQNLTGLTVASGGASITGGLTANDTIVFNNNNNATVGINTGTSTGTVTIGGGSAPLVIDSTNFDVSSIGGLSGITGYTQASGNFAVSGTGTFGTGTGLVSLNGATTITTSTNSVNSLTINGTTGTAAGALRITQSGNAENIIMTNTARTTGALISLTQSTSAFTGTGLLLNFASGSGSFASGDFADFQINGTSRFTVDNTGALAINSDSNNALRITSTAGIQYFNVDVSGNRVTIGNADATAVLFVLDSHSGADPTAVNGASYYNSAANKSRCAEAGVWTDCTTNAVLGETTLGAANATITVTLNRSVEYLHCRIDMKGRSAASIINLRFNGDTGAANYGWNTYSIIAAAIQDAQDASDSEIQLTGTDGDNIPANADINITNFADTRKTVDWTFTGAEAIGTNMQRYSGGGTWNNTANQITSVSFITSAGTFNTGSHAWCEGRNVR